MAGPLIGFNALSLRTPEISHAKNFPKKHFPAEHVFIRDAYFGRFN